MKLLTNILHLSENTVIFSLFIGMLAIAALSLLSLSPVSLEDYNRYLAEEAGDQGQVAGITDNPAQTSGIVIENLLEGGNLSYDFAESEKKSELSLSARYTSKPTKVLPLLRFNNSGFTTKNYRLELEYRGSDAVQTAIKTSSYLSLNNPDYATGITYNLQLPAGEAQEISLLRDVKNSFNEYELREGFDLVLKITLVEPESNLDGREVKAPGLLEQLP